MNYNNKNFDAIVIILQSVVNTLDKHNNIIIDNALPAIKKLEDVTPAKKILTRTKVKEELGLSDIDYKRRVKAGFLVPRKIGPQHYYFQCDLEKQLERPEDNKESKIDNKLKDSIIDNNSSQFCLLHRPVVPQQCAIEGCNHDVEGNQWSNIPLQRPIEGYKNHKEEEQLDTEPPISTNEGIQRQVEGEHPDNVPLHCHNEDIQGHVKRDQCHFKRVQRDAEGVRRPIEGAESSTEGRLPAPLYLPLGRLPPMI